MSAHDLLPRVMLPTRELAQSVNAGSQQLFRVECLADRVGMPEAVKPRTKSRGV